MDICIGNYFDWTADGSYWFPYYGKNTIKTNGYRQLFGNQHSLKYTCVQQKKETHTGLEQLGGE